MRGLGGGTERDQTENQTQNQIQTQNQTQNHTQTENLVRIRTRIRTQIEWIQEMSSQGRISLQNQWKIIECASSGNEPPGTHFVEKPMENNRIHKPGFRQRLQIFDEKPLPNQRNEENRKSNTRVEFR
jgi:hypothetical protein